MKVPRPLENIAVQAGVIVYRNFSIAIMEDEEFHAPRCSLVISIDPITNRRVATVYTDDGHGNGDGILSIELE